MEALVRPVVEASGLELVEASFRREGRSRVLRVTVDREGGLDLETISEASERISRRLDLEDFGPAHYTLEVSSPGVERPLRSARDFERHVGEKVRVRTSTLVEGARSHTGALVAADGEAITVATEVGAHRIPLAEVASARTVFEWGTPAGPAPRKGERKK
ncbi:MAG: ribosome maturation factor RimP [Actinomycetota bacterium]|nr:ribosome maturation factor RimP [Actinomycetota bacterium]